MKRACWGATLLEVVVVVAILALFAVAFGGLLRSIAVGGRNIPKTGNILTQQQVLDEINTFILQFSRDARKASMYSIEDGGRRIAFDGGRIEYSVEGEDNGATRKIVRREDTSEKPVLWGITNNNPFDQRDDGTIVVTLKVAYLAQTKYSTESLQTQNFSFAVQRRVTPSPSP